MITAWHFVVIPAKAGIHERKELQIARHDGLSIVLIGSGLRRNDNQGAGDDC